MGQINKPLRTDTPEEKTSPNEKPNVDTKSPKKTKGADTIKVTMDADDWMFFQNSALSSVPTEDDGYTIKEKYWKYINDNNNTWSNDELKQYFNTYHGGHVFRNHDQDPRLSYGIIVGVVLRKVNQGEDFRYVVEPLMAINKSHSPDKKMVNKIGKDGEFRTSMGCSSIGEKCSMCGNVSVSDNDSCDHIMFQNGKKYVTGYGGTSRIANIVTGFSSDGKVAEYDKEDYDSYPISFYENSILTGEDPAYRGVCNSFKFTFPASTLVDNKITIEMPKKAYTRTAWNALKHWQSKQAIEVTDTNGNPLS